MATLNTLRILSQTERADLRDGSCGVSRRFEAVEVDPGRESRFDRILKRRRARRVHKGGFAPDLSHGPRHLGAIYNVVGEAESEEMVFFTSLDLGEGASLATVGRWQDGFLDTVQCFLKGGHFSDSESMMAFSDTIEGSKAALGLTPSDYGTLKSLTDSCGLSHIDRTHLPVALNRDDLMGREQSVLGLVREDLTESRHIAALREAAVENTDPLSLQRVLDAGKADLLTGVALFVERRALSAS